MQRGFPPKLLWLRIGNCTTTKIEHLLRGRQDAIKEFCEDESKAILSLFSRL